MQDFILNGVGHGSVAETLLENEFDLRALRPWKSRKDGRSYVTTVNEEGKLINNYTPNPALLFKDEWQLVDDVVLKIARNNLRAWGDLSAANSYNLANGMMQTILQWQTMGDSGNAKQSMDGLAEGDRDRPLIDLRGLPLPITHSDFWFSARDLMISRKSRNPLDTTVIEQNTRRIVETIEDMTIGNNTAYAYGGYSIPGYITHSDRIAYTITSPTTAGWTPATLIDELLDMKEQARLVNFFGPFSVYFGTAWERFLDGDYSSAYPGVTLRSRVSQIANISNVRMLDNLSGYQILMVQMTSDNARAVNGMGITVVQWPSQGGMKLNFKILGIYVPQIRSNFKNEMGLIHGSP